MAPDVEDEGAGDDEVYGYGHLSDRVSCRVPHQTEKVSTRAAAQIHRTRNIRSTMGPDGHKTWD